MENDNRFSRIKRKNKENAYSLPNITEILDQNTQNILTPSRQGFTKYRCTKDSFFHSAWTLSFQLNTIRIKERTSHVPKTHGSDIIRLTKERYVRLSGRYHHLRVFHGQTPDEIQ